MPAIRFLPLLYDTHDSDHSARQLVFALRPEWQSPNVTLKFVRFTDGITNTLLKAVPVRTSPSPDQPDAKLQKEDEDRDAILLRAYGHGTDLIIDREREAQNHELLMRYGLAPELLARFQNGMLYRFVRGTVTRPEDMRQPEISLAIARRLAQWHAVVPPQVPAKVPAQIPAQTPPVASASLWTVMQKWIRALPTQTAAQVQRRDLLQSELTALMADLGQRRLPGLGDPVTGLVFAHTDLLSGNVIILPPGTTSVSAAASQTSTATAATTAASTTATQEVTFIDYEYAVPSPAAFDIANHFAEWGGFDCDMAVLPTVSQRRAFIQEYVRTYCQYKSSASSASAVSVSPTALADQLLEEVDVFRGLPGFYWSIWSLIQATISEIDFDYASYAETRLAEYWAWKAERDGSRAASGADLCLRERRWAQETDETGHL